MNRERPHGLHGNGQPCPACALRREEANRALSGRAEVPCNACGGTGWQQFTDEEIVRDAVSWARAHYWPEREKRWAQMNGEAT